MPQQTRQKRFTPAQETALVALLLSGVKPKVVAYDCGVTVTSVYHLSRRIGLMNMQVTAVEQAQVMARRAAAPNGRDEDFRAQLATIIQHGHISDLTSEQIADALMTLVAGYAVTAAAKQGNGV